MKHISTLQVYQVAVLVDWASLFVSRAFASSFLVIGNDEVSFVVPIKISHDVDLVELATIQIQVLQEGAFCGLICSLQHADSVGPRDGRCGRD